MIGELNPNNPNSLKENNFYKFIDNEYIFFSKSEFDIRKYIIKNHCIILPSYREGMPKSLMEAISSGIPVIASNVVGNSDLVLENVNGFLCRPKDNRSLYNVILKVSKIKKQKYNLLSKNCRKYAEYYLDENKVTHKYLTLIKKII